jgi:hypothetical protein
MPHVTSPFAYASRNPANRNIGASKQKTTAGINVAAIIPHPSWRSTQSEIKQNPKQLREGKRTKQQR